MRLKPIERYWVDALAYAKEKGFEIHGLASYELETKIGELWFKAREHERRGRERLAQELRGEATEIMVGDYEQHRGWRAVELKNKGIVADLYLVGVEHAHPMEEYLKKISIDNVKEKSELPLTERRRWLKNIGGRMREKYTGERAKLIERAATALKKWEHHLGAKGYRKPK